jgi:uncharacterized coiled-coil DUF342 family protein
VQVIEDEKSAKETSQAEIETLNAELRTLKRNLEAAQSAARTHTVMNERLLQEAAEARSERDEARGTVNRLMDESAEVSSLQLTIEVLLRGC